MGKRMDRERRTIDAMVRVYCRGRHGTRDGVCGECSALRDYAHARLERCRYQDSKPTCANCPVHCYGPEMRDRVREVMRYSGPRMLLRHPYLAIAHLRDGRRRVPDL
jgi:predicted amidophosphoribosyltransferase